MGQFGGDAHAGMLRTTLLDHGVDISHCRECADRPSGLGLVFLQPDGAVASVVVGGSNAAWPATRRGVEAKDGETEAERRKIGEWWAGVEDLVRGAAALLLQREVPEHVNERLAEVSKWMDGLMNGWIDGWIDGCAPPLIFHRCMVPSFLCV